MDPWSHEQPMLLVLPADLRVEAVLPTLLADPGIRHYALPPLWALDRTGLDLAAALPNCRSVTLESMEEVLGSLIRLCDGEQLDVLVRSTWASVDERVRQYYLELGVAAAMAGIFKVGPRTLEREPPASFVRDRIAEHGFEVQYRLEAEGRTEDWTAPPHEGTLTVYPFDPAATASRAEAGVEPGSGAVLEVFAYASGRDRHRAFWQTVAEREGWQLVDPQA
jgi:hypothetical protein